MGPARLFAALQPWREVDEGIHRRLARLVEPQPDQETLWIGCGRGRSALWWAERFGGRVVGVDADADALEQAEESARGAGLTGRASFQLAAADDLPHQAQAFDLVVVHALYLPGYAPGAVLQEAARVVRPMGLVAAILPTWLAAADPAAAAALAPLVCGPRQIMEWKQLFRDAGVVELQVDDAATDDRWLAASWPGLAFRAWRAGGWPAFRSVLAPNVRALVGLSRRRVLGLSLLKGSRWPHA